jgi:3-hydroxyacyl-CoA dehydrogenase
VIALESYIGLVEAGVGLIPAGGGCKEFAIRAAQHAARTAGNDPFEFIQPVFMTIAMATVSKSGRTGQGTRFCRRFGQDRFQCQRAAIRGAA